MRISGVEKRYDLQRFVLLFSGAFSGSLTRELASSGLGEGTAGSVLLPDPSCTLGGREALNRNVARGP